MRLLVTGAAGLLAAAIVREFGQRDDVRALDRSALDVTQSAACARIVADAHPDVVINCAGYNDVDGAEDNAVAALQVNALAVLALSRAARSIGATFVHYSSDFVFDGSASRPYREDDSPSPRGVYASSKLLGEWLALEHPDAYVLRVESLFGESPPGHSRRGSVGTIVDRIRQGATVPVFVDRTVSPSFTADVARATRELIDRRAAPGLYHCVNSGAASWRDIADEIARRLNMRAQLEPITLGTAGLKALRPRYCALSNAKLQAAGISMPPWQDAIGRFLAVVV